MLGLLIDKKTLHLKSYEYVRRRPQFVAMVVPAIGVPRVGEFRVSSAPTHPDPSNRLTPPSIRNIRNRNLLTFSEYVLWLIRRPSPRLAGGHRQGSGPRDDTPQNHPRNWLCFFGGPLKTLRKIGFVPSFFLPPFPHRRPRRGGAGCGIAQLTQWAKTMPALPRFSPFRGPEAAAARPRPSLEFAT